MTLLIEKLLGAATGKVASAGMALVPDWWTRRALAELRDRNPWAGIALNHDLLRAVRLAWIEAALDVVEAAAALADRSEWRGQTEAIRGFADAARDDLRRARNATLDTGRHPGDSPIDAQARAILAGVPEVGAPAPVAEHGAAIRQEFVATLAALSGWPADVIPAAFGQVAAAGLAVKGGPPRPFGDLVLAAFAETLKNPRRYPQAREAFHIAMEKAARDLAEATLAAVRGIDAGVDAALARLDRLAVAQDGLGQSLALLPEVAAGVGLIDERAARIEVKVDALLASDRGRTVAEAAGESGLSGETLRDAMLRLWAEGLGRDDLIAELERWLAKYLEERARGVNEDAAFRAALAEARRRVEAGRIAEASAAFMDEFAREETEEVERQEERRRRRLRLLEEAVRFDELALNGAAAAGKLRLMAEIEGAADADARGAWLFAKAGEFSERGASRGDNPALLVAIATYRAALEEHTRERVPLQWAMTQNKLGNALQTLGQRESGAGRLEEAVRAYRAALEAYTRERVPLAWAATQSNLGTALATLGQRESGTGRLEEAVRAYRAALAERTREQVPLEWAATQSNLGSALATLGERESGTSRLEEAVRAYLAALEVYKRECAPLDWATTQNNLGNALATLGQRESGAGRLEEAVRAYRAALAERTRERVPLEWAATQNNLGTALATLGERESGTGRLEEAVTAFRVALAERTRERVSPAWAATQNNLGNALRMLGERESGTGRLEEAVQAHSAALAEYTRERAPIHWAMTAANLGMALVQVAERRSNMIVALEARDGLAAARDLFREAGHPPYTEACEAMLADAEALVQRLGG